MSNLKSMYAISKLKRNVKGFGLKGFKQEALQVYKETCQLLAEGDQSRLRQVSPLCQPLNWAADIYFDIHLFIRIFVCLFIYLLIRVFIYLLHVCLFTFICIFMFTYSYLCESNLPLLSKCGVKWSTGTCAVADRQQVVADECRLGYPNLGSNFVLAAIGRNMLRLDVLFAEAEVEAVATKQSWHGCLVLLIYQESTVVVCPLTFTWPLEIQLLLFHSDSSVPLEQAPLLLTLNPHIFHPCAVQRQPC